MKVLYKKEKGVSPVIATILMVAITVVLASAVYLIVSGYFSGTPSKPVAIGVVTSTNATATKFLISSGNISVTSSTPLTITISTSSGNTYTITLTGVVNSSNYIKVTTSSSTPIAVFVYSITGNTYLAGGDYIALGLGSKNIGESSPLPPGTTVTWTYNGNVIYSTTL